MLRRVLQGGALGMVAVLVLCGLVVGGALAAFGVFGDEGDDSELMSVIAGAGCGPAGAGDSRPVAAAGDESGAGSDVEVVAPEYKPMDPQKDGPNPSIVAIARALVRDKGVSRSVAMATFQMLAAESNFRNLANSKVQRSLALPNDGVGHDGQSVGPAQQQVGLDGSDEFGWGSVSEAMDPENAISVFIDKAVELESGVRGDTADLAQAVNRSAFSDGSNYREQEARAAELLGEIAKDPASDADRVPAIVPVSDVSPASKHTADDSLTPATRVVFDEVAARWGDRLDTIGGTRQGDKAGDHGEGRAVDVMIPDWDSAAGRELGTEIASYFETHAVRYGVDYLIWRNQIWLSGSSLMAGWGPYNGGGMYAASELNSTTLHMDHVHISVRAGAPAGGAEEAADVGSDGDDRDQGGEDDERGCVPRFAGLFGGDDDDDDSQGGSSGSGGASSVDVDGSDDLPWKGAAFCSGNPCGPGTVSPLQVYNRECVDFVLWKLNQMRGAGGAPWAITNSCPECAGGRMGNAAQWKAAWDAKGWPSGSEPRVGAVVWYGPHAGPAGALGHVGLVESLDEAGNPVIIEYNVLPHADHSFNRRTASADEASAYLYLPESWAEES